MLPQQTHSVPLKLLMSKLAYLGNKLLALLVFVAVNVYAKLKAYQTFLYLEITVKPRKGCGAVQLLVRIPTLNELFLSLSLQGLITYLPNLVG